MNLKTIFKRIVSRPVKNPDRFVAVFDVLSAGYIKATSPITTQDADGVLKRFLMNSGFDWKIKINLVESFAELSDKERTAAEKEESSNEKNASAILHKNCSVLHRHTPCLLEGSFAVGQDVLIPPQTKKCCQEAAIWK